MQHYKEEKPTEEIEQSFNVYHQAIVTDLTEEEVKPTEGTTNIRNKLSFTCFLFCNLIMQFSFCSFDNGINI